jgi:signal transduction histidine kinase
VGLALSNAGVDRALLALALVVAAVVSGAVAQRLVRAELERSFDGIAEALGRREREVEENQERLAAMSRRLLAAQEGERRRIARELHDELGQLLTGAHLNLVSLQGGSARPHPGFDPLDDTLDLVDRALTTVRELSTELRPAVLDDGGLEDALRWLLDRVSHRAGFEARFEVQPIDAELSAEIQTTLFRVAQEALTNVMRHAGATEVVMTLCRRDNALELLVRDNGVGFDPGVAQKRASTGQSMGMIGMQERVGLIGGRLELESAPGRGVLLRATVPLEESWKAQAAS